MKSDPLGDRIKQYERRETDHRFLPFVPVVARMDGRGFSKFTRGLPRPFDADFSRAMIETAKRLVKETSARIAYTQSDEITLVWLIEELNEQMKFDGKAQKLCSVLAGMTSAIFITELMNSPSAELRARVVRAPHFDARVFQVPSRTEAANAVLWRERDAVKNAMSMACRAYYSHREMHGKNRTEMNEMLLQKGIVFASYPDFFRRGSFLQARTREVPYDATSLEKIPARKRPVDGATFLRRAIERIDMPAFNQVANREEVIFDATDPFLLG